MAFNPENKLTFEELAPSLQQIINSKAKKSDFDATFYKHVKRVDIVGKAYCVEK